MSLSSRQHLFSSQDAFYHTVPQFADSNILLATSDFELIGDDESCDDPIVTALDNPVDPRIRWICFLFGSSNALPWNGAAFVMF